MVSDNPVYIPYISVFSCLVMVCSLPPLGGTGAVISLLHKTPNNSLSRSSFIGCYHSILIAANYIRTKILAALPFYLTSFSEWSKTIIQWLHI